MPLPGLQGQVKGDTRITCTACAGTLLLEFGVLSRLTGNATYEQKARHAMEVRLLLACCSCACWLTWAADLGGTSVHDATGDLQHWAGNDRQVEWQPAAGSRLQQPC